MSGASSRIRPSADPDAEPVVVAPLGTKFDAPVRVAMLGGTMPDEEEEEAVAMVESEVDGS